MNTISESIVRESIEKNMGEFRDKALRGSVSGEDVANLFGYGEMFTEGEEFESFKNEVVSKMPNREIEGEETNPEKDAIGRTVLAEADEEDTPEEENTAQDNTEETNNEESVENDTDSETEDTNDSEEEGDESGEEDKKGEEEPKDDKEKEEEEKGPLKDGETTHLESFQELFDETNVRIRIQKQGLGPEPSPLFGQSQTKHNKYKISLTNDKGGDISWTYWDSEKNTKDGIVPDTETVMKDFGLKLESVVVGISFERFKEDFGYDNMDNALAQKQYDGLRKMKDNIKKIFPDQHNVYQLIQIAKKS